MPTANEIRQQFIDFFVTKHGHTAVPSSPVVPQDDPTLLFTNAGMNQFKDVFLGTGTRPYKRAVDSQKCIRAGGKHNDLEDVGRDTYHHTFFEMLGNWSFGDYFKKEAIAWAWELLTKVWKLDKGRLHATVFEGDPEAGLARDDEAAEFWRAQTDIDPSHIHLGSKKDNFWMMGDTGPCGPCSEIHYDRTPDQSGGKLVNEGDARVIEIWNLVFIQFNRDEEGKLHTLPAKHVDTGMGFERITAVLQGKESNYDTDVFGPLLNAIGDLVHRKYGGKLDDPVDVAFRVIADHIRALTFALTDGAVPDREGRGYVVRNILRRAERFGWQHLGTEDPFLYKLVKPVVNCMGEAYPEISANAARVTRTILEEEEGFLKTLARGFRLFEWAALEAISASLRNEPKLSEIKVTKPFGAATKLTFFYDGKPMEFPCGLPPREFMNRYCPEKPKISGKSAFDLHTEQGIFIDITEQMASEIGVRVDRPEYERLMREHEKKSRTHLEVEGTSEFIDLLSDSMLEEVLKRSGDDRLKWSTASTTAKVLGVFERGGKVGLLLDRTCFYSESGGQVGDTGTITTESGELQVDQVARVGGGLIHIGYLTRGKIEIGQDAQLRVDPERDFTRKNHTATHLLHWALHKVLGEHVEQRGSKVKPDEFTFDFSHTGPMTDAEKAEVERLVNEKIYQDLPVQWRALSIAEAKKLPGVRAFFGDKYGDVVRVVEIGDGFSREFCGGTHLDHTGQAGYFKIIAEEAVGKGVRRLTCVTAREAVKAVQKEDAIIADLTTRFRCKPEELPNRIDGLQEEIKELTQQLKKGAASDLQSVADKLLADAPETKGSRIIVGEMPAGPEEQLRQQVDRLRQKAPSSVVVIGWSDDGKVGLLAAVTEDLVKKGLHAGKLVGQVATIVGGKGGGKPTMAQAGGKDPAKLGEALALARKLATDELR
jgi:alanyl-tRNA synthetase